MDHKTSPKLSAEVRDRAARIGLNLLRVSLLFTSLREIF